MDNAAPPESATVLLAVSAPDDSAKELVRRLSEDGRTVHLAASAQEARDALAEHTPDVVILDAAADYAKELRQWLCLQDLEHSAGLVALYPAGGGPQKLSGFTVLEDESVVEPYELNDLVTVIDEEYARLAHERKHLRRSMQMYLPSDPNSVMHAGNFLARLLHDVNLEERERVLFVNAIREALDNAYRHGNRARPDRKISVEYDVDPTRAVVSIQDQGDGFDTDAYLGDGLDADAVSVARRSAQKSDEEAGGLGVMLMVRCVDKVEYNHKGNAVRLTKRLQEVPVS